MESEEMEFTQHADMLARSAHELALARGCKYLHNAADWFFAAGSAVKLDCVTGMHDDSALWCMPAAEYEDRRSKLWTAHLTELARFTFCWTGFECLSKGLFSKAELRQGMLPALTGRFKGHKTSELANSPLCRHLRRSGERLAVKLESLMHPCDHHLKALDSLRPDNLLGKGAIQAIKALRNAFAHGGAYLPFPDDDNEVIEGNQTTAVIALSNTLILNVSQYFLFISASPDELARDFTHQNYYEGDLTLALILLAGASVNFGSEAKIQLYLFE